MNKKNKKLILLSFILIGGQVFGQNTIRVGIDLNIPTKATLEMSDRVKQAKTLETLGYSTNQNTQGSFSSTSDWSSKGKIQLTPITIDYLTNVGPGKILAGLGIANYFYTATYSGFGQFKYGPYTTIPLIISGGTASYKINENDIHVGYEYKILEGFNLTFTLGNLTHKRTISFSEISSGNSSNVISGVTIINTKITNNFNDYSSTAKGLYYKLDFEYAIDPTISLLFGYKTGNLKGDTDYTNTNINISSSTFSSFFGSFSMFSQTQTLNSGIGWSVNVKINEILIGASYKLSDTSKLRFGIQNLTYKVSYPDSLATFVFNTFISTTTSNIPGSSPSSYSSTSSGINLALINDNDPFIKSLIQLEILKLTSNSNTYEDKRTAIFIGYTKDFNF